MNFPFKTVRLELADDVGTITLNRPERFNAYNSDMLREIGEALDECEWHSARAILLTGAGKAFCSGADLSEMDWVTREERDLGDRLKSVTNPLLERLRTFPVPTVAAINGVAAGAGFGFALCADIAIAGRSASLMCPFTKIGLVPDAGVTWKLPRLIGRARAAGMLLLSERIPAETAAEWGLIWQMVEDDALHSTAWGIAAKLADGPTAALARTKQALDLGLATGLAESMELEHQYQSFLGRTEDHREGVSAFLEKRKPRYKGR